MSMTREEIVQLAQKLEPTAQDVLRSMLAPLVADRNGELTFADTVEGLLSLEAPGDLPPITPEENEAGLAALASIMFMLSGKRTFLPRGAAGRGA
jgi:hypothetical protein